MDDPESQPDFVSQPNEKQRPPAYQPPLLQPIQHQPGFSNQEDIIASAHLRDVHAFQDYLKDVTSFRVKQKIRLLEVVTCWHKTNKYSISDGGGNKYKVREKSERISRQCCGFKRDFELTFKDKDGSDLLLIERPLNLSCCFGSSCVDKLTISSPGGQKFGSVVETYSLMRPKFDLKDAVGNVVLKIVGPLCTVGVCCQPVVFHIFDLAGVVVGEIKKEWSGATRELLTDVDFISLSFRPDLDPAMKAVCLGALFIIEYEYFEGSTLPQKIATGLCLTYSLLIGILVCR